MTLTRRNFLQLSGLTAGALVAGNLIHWTADSAAVAATIDPSLHVLQRLTWGVRPEDLRKINSLGISGYLDWQLAPEQIADPAVDAFLRTQPTLGMGYKELYALAEKNDSSIYNALIWGRIYRAAFSTRQLYELMVEFWTDHFNIPLPDLIVEKTVDDRTVIRRYALGRFRELLGASARSPAMLYYLNNADSHKEHPNENYARELLELHTLGVGGGYTEADVKAVARAFTGWSAGSDVPGLFYFDDVSHDYTEKTVLGHRLPAAQGIEDGRQVLDILATHPATAQFISRKLCRRFVSDRPSQGLVDHTAAVFRASGGDIRRVLRAILSSTEFMQATGQKFRRPLDFMVAGLRVTRPTFDDPSILQGPLTTLGQVPFLWHPPNGYPDAARPWLNAGGLLNRWNTAMLLAGGLDDSIHVDLDARVPPAPTAVALVDSATLVVLGRLIAAADRAQLVAFVADGSGPQTLLTSDMRADKLPALIGLLLASPYFQWH